LQSMSSVPIPYSDVQKRDATNGGCDDRTGIEFWFSSQMKPNAKPSQHDSGLRDKKTEELSRWEGGLSSPLTSLGTPAQFDVHLTCNRQEDRSENYGHKSQPSSILRPGSPLRIQSPSRTATMSRPTQDRAPQQQREWSPLPSRASPSSSRSILAYPPSPDVEQPNRSTLDLQRRGYHPQGQDSLREYRHDVSNSWRISSHSSLDDPFVITHGGREGTASRLGTPTSERWSAHAVVGHTYGASSRFDEDLRSSRSFQSSFSDSGSARADAEPGGSRRPQLQRSVSFEEPIAGSGSRAGSRAGSATPRRCGESGGDAPGSRAHASPRPASDRSGLSPRPAARIGQSPGLPDRYASSPRPERSAASITPLTSSLWKPTFRPSRPLPDGHRPRALRGSHDGIGVR